MNDQNAIREKLWDLVYGLLEPDEVAALHAQITSDPAVARLYADTMLEAELFAKAARVEAPAIELPVPRDKVGPARPPAWSATKQPGAGVSSLSRGLNWFAAMGATALALLIAVMLWRPETSAMPATAAVRVVEVFGAPRWQPGISNQVKVVARAPNGVPESVALRVEVRDPEGHVNYFRQIQTSPAGIADLEIPGEAVKAGNQLQVQLADGTSASTWYEADGATLTAPLPAQQEAQRAAVTVDRGWHEPGDELRFRVNVLGQRTLEPAQQAAVHYEMTGPDGKKLDAVDGYVVATNGVAAGAVKLPADAPEGRYLLRVRGDNAPVAPDAADFVVQRRSLKESLGDLAESKSKDSGTTASGSKALSGKEGDEKAPAGKPLASSFGGGMAEKQNASRALAKRSTLERTEREESFFKREAGRSENLPRLAAAQKSGEEVAAKAGLKLDDSKSVDQQALASDRFGRESEAVAEVDASRRYKMSLPPSVAGKRLKIIVADAQGEVLQASEAVAQTTPETSQPGRGARPADGAVAARNNLSQLGKIAGELGKNDGEKGEKVEGLVQERLAEVELTLAPEVQGQVQTFAVDAAERPARVVAQNELYVPPRRELAIFFDDFDQDHIAGENVDLALQVTDEANRPIPNAVLGVRVVDEVALQAAPELDTLASRWEMAAPLAYGNYFGKQDHYFGLAAGEPAKRGLEMATSDVRDAEPELDKKSSEKGVALGAVRQGLDGKVAVDNSLGRQNNVLAFVESGDTILASNRAAVESTMQRSSFARSRQRAVDLRFAGQVLIAGAVALAALAAIVYGFRLRPSGKVWVPALSMAAASLLLGLAWLDQTSPRRTEVALGVKDALQAPAKSPPATPLSDEPEDLARDDRSGLARGGVGGVEGSGSGRLQKTLNESVDRPFNRFAYEATPPAGSAPGSPVAETPSPADRVANDSAPKAPPGSLAPTGGAQDARRGVSRKAEEQEFERKKEALDALRDNTRGESNSPQDNAGPKPQMQSPAKPAAAAQPAGPPPPAPAPAASTPLSSTESKPMSDKESAKDASDPAFSKLRAPMARPAEPATLPTQRTVETRGGETRAGGFGSFKSSSASLAEAAGAAVNATENYYVPLWEPALVTDETGKAHLRFKLPPRSAVYRVFVDAHGRGRIGSATATLVATPADKKEATEKEPPADSDKKE